MRGDAAIFAAALIMAPLGARAADLVVWWEQAAAPEDADQADFGGVTIMQRLIPTLAASPLPLTPPRPPTS